MSDIDVNITTIDEVVNITTENNPVNVTTEDVNVNISTEGSQGPRGFRGISVSKIFIRSANQPVTPLGGSFNYITDVLTPPIGWFITPPNGTIQLWESQSHHSEDRPLLTWSTPFEANLVGPQGDQGIGINDITGPTTVVPGSDTTITVTLRDPAGTNPLPQTFLIPPGARGKSILSGIGTPSDSLGVDGDFYINLSIANDNRDLGDMYQKESGSWVFKYKTRGVNGEHGTLTEWSPTVNYVVGDLVIHNYNNDTFAWEEYVCLVDNTNEDPRLATQFSNAVETASSVDTTYFQQLRPLNDPNNRTLIAIGAKVSGTDLFYYTLDSDNLPITYDFNTDNILVDHLDSVYFKNFSSTIVTIDVNIDGQSLNEWIADGNLASTFFPAASAERYGISTLTADWKNITYNEISKTNERIFNEGIQRNTNSLSNNSVLITDNTANITTNTNNIATNTTNIVNNTSSISTNTSDIASNLVKINSNTNNITTNTTNINSVSGRVSTIEGAYVKDATVSGNKLTLVETVNGTDTNVEYEPTVGDITVAEDGVNKSIAIDTLNFTDDIDITINGSIANISVNTNHSDTDAIHKFNNSVAYIIDDVVWSDWDNDSETPNLYRATANVPAGGGDPRLDTATAFSTADYPNTATDTNRSNVDTVVDNGDGTFNISYSTLNSGKFVYQQIKALEITDQLGVLQTFSVSHVGFDGSDFVSTATPFGSSVVTNIQQGNELHVGEFITDWKLITPFDYIEQNRRNIKQNAELIDTNTTNITTNVAAISSNKSEIDTHTLLLDNLEVDAWQSFESTEEVLIDSVRFDSLDDNFYRALQTVPGGGANPSTNPTDGSGNSYWTVQPLSHPSSEDILLRGKPVANTTSATDDNTLATNIQPLASQEYVDSVIVPIVPHNIYHTWGHSINTQLNTGNRIYDTTAFDPYTGAVTFNISGFASSGATSFRLSSIVPFNIFSYDAITLNGDLYTITDIVRDGLNDELWVITVSSPLTSNYSSATTVAIGNHIRNPFGTLGFTGSFAGNDIAITGGLTITDVNGLFSNETRTHNTARQINTGIIDTLGYAVMDYTETGTAVTGELVFAFEAPFANGITRLDQVALASEIFLEKITNNLQNILNTTDGIFFEDGVRGNQGPAGGNYGYYIRTVKFHFDKENTTDSFAEQFGSDTQTIDFVKPETLTIDLEELTREVIANTNRSKVNTERVNDLVGQYSWWQILLQGNTNTNFISFNIDGGQFMATTEKEYEGQTYFRIKNQPTNLTKKDGWYINTTTTTVGTEVKSAQREF